MNNHSHSRYSVSVSAGRDYQVWDRVERKVVAKRKTFVAAQREAKRRNKVEREAS